MVLKIGKQNLIAESASIRNSSNKRLPDDAEAKLGIGGIKDEMEDIGSVKSQLAPVENLLKSLVNEIESNITEEEQMRDDVQQTQEAQSNLERSAKQSSSLFTDLDGILGRI